MVPFLLWGGRKVDLELIFLVVFFSIVIISVIVVFLDAPLPL